MKRFALRRGSAADHLADAATAALYRALAHIPASIIPNDRPVR